MDQGESSASTAVSGPRKRRRSSDWENATPGIGHEPMALEYSTTGSPLQLDAKSKRPRLSSSVDPVIGSARSKQSISHGHMKLANLPPEILQHVFTFVDPVALGQLICVNHLFRTLLDPTCPLPQKTTSTQTKQLVLRAQDSIWTISRRTFMPGFPKPMDAMTELEMWRLVRGSHCQFCGKKATHRQSFLICGPWNAGPGLDNVRPIWPFRVRSCGHCLLSRLVKDTELAFSGNSALRFGLPFAFLTHDLNYIPSSVIQHKSPPPNLELIKYYFRPQLDELERRFRNVEALGAATLGEWKKGLETTGQEKNAEVIRFEQHELRKGFSIPVPPTQKDAAMLDISTTLPSQGYQNSKPDRTQEMPPRSAVGTPSSGYIPLEISNAGSINDDNQSTAGKSSNGTLPGVVSAPRGLTGQPALRQSASQHFRHRIERSQGQANDAKAERRKEIERRCLGLRPPIMPSTLAYMDAFQAAILISLPFDDRAWEVLRPRLMSQRVDAEQRETRTALSDPSVQQAKRQQLEEEQRIAQANTSHMWHGLKVSSRDKLRKIAEEFILMTWSDGRAVTRATASKFAAEVLFHLRQRFNEVIVQEDDMLALKGTAFPQDSASLASRKLTLQDMKWAFQEFVQPHTQRFGKDLFLCHVCDTNQKLFAFEAIIQHFASKHTNTLSHGNSIVSWEAQWPTDPPFDPHPNIPWALGAANSATQSQSHRQPRSLPSHGVPSISDKMPRPESVFSGNPTPYMGNPETGALLHHVRGPFDHVPARHPAGLASNPFTHSSAARSDASGLAMDEDYPVRYGKLPQRGAPGPPYPLEFPTGKRHGNRPAHSLPQTETAPYGVLPKDFHGARSWGPYREQRPLSHGSTVYSFEDGSSRFSYGDALARGHGTTSEFGRESKATSHASVHRSRSSAPDSSFDNPGDSRVSVDEAVARSAVDDFLNNFDPTIDGGTSNSSRLDVEAARSPDHDLDLPLHMIPPRRPASGHVMQHPNRTPMSSPHTGHPLLYSPPVHRTSLPIRESERYSGLVVNSPSHSRYSPSLRLARDHEVYRRPPSGGMYLEEVPSRLRRSRYEIEGDSNHDTASVYTEPSFGHRYVYDDDGRKYEEIREDEIGRYSLEHDRFSDHPQQPYVGGEIRYMEDRGSFLDQAADRGNYGRSVPKSYYSSDIEYRPQRDLESPLIDQYREEEPAITEHGTRTIRWDDRDVVYQPVESPGRPTNWSSGMSRPEN